MPRTPQAASKILAALRTGRPMWPCHVTIAPGDVFRKQVDVRVATPRPLPARERRYNALRGKYASIYAAGDIRAVILSYVY